MAHHTPMIRQSNDQESPQPVKSPFTAPVSPGRSRMNKLVCSLSAATGIRSLFIRSHHLKSHVAKTMIGVFVDHDAVVVCDPLGQWKAKSSIDYLGRSITTAEDVYAVLSKVREQQPSKERVCLIWSIREGFVANKASIEWQTISQNLPPKLPTDLYCMDSRMALAIGAGLDVYRLQRQIVAVVTEAYSQFFVLFGCGVFDAGGTGGLKIAASWKEVEQEVNHIERTVSDFPENFKKGEFLAQDYQALREGWPKAFVRDVPTFCGGKRPSFSLQNEPQPQRIQIRWWSEDEYYGAVMEGIRQVMKDLRLVRK